MHEHQDEAIGTAARAMAKKVESFVRDTVMPFERDSRQGTHGPDGMLVQELRALAREAGVLTPHISESGEHFTQLETALILRKSGAIPPGPRRTQHSSSG
jgi:acyl-CoA dehydrogenase